MQNIHINQIDDNITPQLSLPELRDKWAEYWGMRPHSRIGRALLEKSLKFKIREVRGEGLSAEQQQQLARQITAYKRNPKFFREGFSELKPGIRLVKNYNGENHGVLVRENGFEYREKYYTSLSEIASIITGTRWNGWVFFGLKKRGGGT